MRSCTYILQHFTQALTSLSELDGQLIDYDFRNLCNCT